MGKTPILQLETSNSTTDASQKFLTYRMNQNGDINSNMTKIDSWADTVNKKVKELQDRVSTVLLNANWVSLGYYEATTLDVTELKANMLFTIRLNKDNDGTTTIKVNGLTTKSLLKYDSSGALVNLMSGDLKKNKEYQFRYDGTSFVWQSGVSGDQVNVVGEDNNLLSVSSNGTIEDSGISKDTITANISDISDLKTSKADKTQVLTDINTHNEALDSHEDIRDIMGELASLTTDEKANLVNAINEVKLQSNEKASKVELYSLNKLSRRVSGADTPTLPTDYVRNFEFVGLRNRSAMDFPPLHAHIFGVNGHSDLTAHAFEVAFGDNKNVYYRNNVSSAKWDKWKQFATTDKIEIPFPFNAGYIQANDTDTKSVLVINKSLRTCRLYFSVMNDDGSMFTSSVHSLGTIPASYTPLLNCNTTLSTEDGIVYIVESIRLLVRMDGRVSMFNSQNINFKAATGILEWDY